MSLREALKAVKDDIKTVQEKPKFVPKHFRKQEHKPQKPERPKQYVNGYEVHWDHKSKDNKAIPYIRTETALIQFPIKPEDIHMPDGCVRATYNPDTKRVEYYKLGSDEPIFKVQNNVHNPLPIPRYFSALESVEEIFDLDLETGEITSEMKIDVLDEAVHWKLRLEEYERLQNLKGMPKHVIKNKLQKYIKNLEAQRGITLAQLAQPIPQSVHDAIEYAEKKQRMMNQ